MLLLIDEDDAASLVNLLVDFTGLNSAAKLLILPPLSSCPAIISPPSSAVSLLSLVDDNLVGVLLLVVVGENTARDLLVVACNDAAASIAAKEFRVVRLPRAGVEGVIVLFCCVELESYDGFA